MKLKRTLSIFSSLILLSLGAFSQDQEEVSGEIEDVQVIIEKDKPLTLPTASRIYKRAEIKRVLADTSSLIYKPSLPKFQFEQYEPSFKPKAFRDVRSSKKTINYAKIGFGNYLSPLLEGFIAVEERLNYASIWLQHESFAKGPIRGKESGFSTNKVVIDGRYVARYFEFQPIISFNREVFNYFGYNDEAYSQALPVSDRIYIQDQATFSSLVFGGTLSSISKNKIAASFTPTYQTTSMRVKGGDKFNTDNLIKLDGAFDYSMSQTNKINVIAGFNWAQYDGGASTFSRSKAYINPSYQYRKDDFVLSAGFNVVSGKDSTSQLYFYPDVEAKYFINDKISIQARVGGDLELNTLESLYGGNVYLDDSLSIVNTNKAITFEVTTGIKLSERFLLEASAGYEVIEGQPLFVYSPVDTSRFSVKYDDNFGKFRFGVKGVYFVENQTFISADFSLYTYKESAGFEAWFLPLRALQLEARHRFIKGLTAGISVDVVSGIKSPNVLLLQDESLLSESSTQDLIFDLGLNVNYELKENIELYTTVDNMLNQKYEWYKNYPSRGIAAKMGFIFRF
ncbi:MAG: hypothetical protein JXR03_12960 [Cyclobacteriaceae bacterium]